MAVFFTRLRVGHPDPLQEPPNHPNSWKVFTVCSEQTKASCSTRADVLALGSDSDRGHARSAYQGLQKRAAIGLPLQALYDKDACHEAYSFTHNEHVHKVFRLRQGPIRVYFFYLNDKRIALLKTWSKRKDRLTEGEESQLKDAAQSILTTIEEYGFAIRELK